MLLIYVGESSVGNQLLQAYGPLSQDLRPYEEEREQNLEVHGGERGFDETRDRARGGAYSRARLRSSRPGPLTTPLSI